METLLHLHLLFQTTTQLVNIIPLPVVKPVLFCNNQIMNRTSKSLYLAHSHRTLQEKEININEVRNKGIQLKGGAKVPANNSNVN
jgi:hypothetical protein